MSDSSNKPDRRDFMKLAGIGGLVFASGLGANAFGGGWGGAVKDDFYFVQLSDTHLGFEGPKVNPDAQGTLKKAIAAVNSLEQQPDFVVFTGDLTHTTEDKQLRRDRMKAFKDIVGNLKVKDVRFMAGEHDASLDQGEAYQENFGKLHYTFEHKGIHFIVLDNVSDSEAIIGDTQLKWLQADLQHLKKTAPIVVLTHRPLFDLYPQWDWTTKDGTAVIDRLMPYQNVTVFYGHIHQENHFKTGHIEHHAAKSLMFPLPASGSVPKRVPLQWDDTAPYKGMGFREVEANFRKATYDISEQPVTKG